MNKSTKPLNCGSRFATGIPLRFLLYDLGNDGARCNFVVVAVRFSVLALAVIFLILITNPIVHFHNESIVKNVFMNALVLRKLNWLR